MAGVKITDLPAAASALLTDVFPIDQLPGPVTYKESNSQLLSLFQANGAALTRTNDTNVTMTLGGASSTALLNATSMTLGWTGSLAVARGGTGNTTFTAYSVICGGTTSTGAFQNVSGVGTFGQVLTSNGAALLPTWQSVPAPTGAALTKTDDTNVTLTLGGSPSTALVNAASITAGWAGQLSLARGGTNAALIADLGAIPYSTASAIAFLASTSTAGKILQSGASAAPIWSTPTYPSSSGTSGKVIASDGTNNVYSTATFPIASATAGKIIISDGTNWIASTSIWPNTVGTNLHLVLSNGTSNVYSTPAYPNASVTAGKVIISDGTNYIASTSIFPNTVGTSGKILISDGTSNVYSTPTYPAVAGTSGNVLTSDGTNWNSTAPSASSPLTTKGDIYTFTTVNARLAVGATNGQILQVSSGAATGLAWSTTTWPATTTANRILYSSATNTIGEITSAASGVLVTDGSSVPSISSTLPAFTTSSITFSPTTGGIVGTTTNDDVAAGKVGEYIESNIAFAGNAITSGVTTNLTSISLSAGDWDVYGCVGISPATSVSFIQGSISQTSATFANVSRCLYLDIPGVISSSLSLPVPFQRLSLSTTTTIYLVVKGSFVGASTMFGTISARRAR